MHRIPRFFWKVAMMILQLLAMCVFLASLGCQASARQHYARPAAGNDGFVGASDWQAHVNHQPPGPAKLMVTGKVKVASAGDTAELVADDSAKAGGPGLKLRVVVKRSDGPSAQAVTTREVRFESEDQIKANRVIITYPDGKQHTIDQVGQGH
jgi:hypothetical protein